MPKRGEVVLWSGAFGAFGESGGLSGWAANAAQGSSGSVGVERGSHGSELRFDFSLAGHGAWAIARRDVAFELPAHYVVTFGLRGDAEPHELQVKLVDPSGANVWWWRRRDFSPSHEGSRLVLRRASLEFAWGPRSGGDPDRVGAVEIAVASDRGAAGTLWIEDLRVEPREPPAGPPQVCSTRASSSLAGHDAARALERDESTFWCAAPGDACPWLELDLGQTRECGGLAVDFAGVDNAPASCVKASEDGARWTTLANDPGGGGARRWIRTGEADARFLRLELAAGARAGVSRVEVVPIERAVSPARFASAVARAAPRGRFPRHLLGEHAYWALVGGDGDERKGLLGADGALEVDAEAFTLEPFLWTGGRLLTWADAELGAGLEDGSLPIPSVVWNAAGLRLRITAFADGTPGESTLVARYVVESTDGAPHEVRLFVAIRPFQVTPAWQSLNLAGAVAPIERLASDGARVHVDERRVVTVSAADGFGAARSEEGLAALSEGRLPEAESAHDPLGFAEGALAFDLRVLPPAGEAIVIAVPLFDATPSPPAALGRAAAAAWGDARLAEAASRWRARLARVPISLPPAAAPFEQSLRASLAWILVNREGPRIQPGPRCYRRSWIRDGVMTGTALAEMGFADELRDFLRWYAPFQQPDGRVPCGVDRRGIDRAVEHDSHGQLVFGVVEHARLTGDRTLLRELWPHVLRAVDAIAALRAERTGESFRGDPRFGLLPESISHEGYSSNPVHSYWDDFFAVRALADAAESAAVLGDAPAAASIGALRDAMRRDLHASIALAMERHGIDFLPGSAELGDFDPTSTAIALDPCGEGDRLSPAALARTFERYFEEFEARRRGEHHLDAYTPYEIRNAVALLRLGWRERALAVLDWLVGDQRPPAWRQWPEVSTRDPRAPRFLGDLPHGWVASSFVRSVRRLIAFEDDDAGTLVIGAGVPEAWVREAPGVRVRGLPTHFGALDLDLRAEGEGQLRARFGGGCRPPGGFVLESPFARPLREVVVDGRERAAGDPHRLCLASDTREVELRTRSRDGVA